MKSFSLPKYAEIFILAASGTAFIAYFLFQNEYLTDLDIHFHITVADLIAERGWVRALPWMPHSIHADRYVDYHLIIHYLQALFIPLTGNDLILAARLSGLMFLFFSLSMLVLLLQEMGSPYRWFWVLVFLLSSSLFSLRLLYLRGSILFIGVIFLFIFLIIRRKYYLMGVLCFFAVWTYPGFPILVIFAGLFWGVQFFEGNLDFRLLAFPVAGALLGVIIHPAFPYQFYGFWLELGIHSLRPQGLETIQEWAPASHASIPIAYGIPILLLLTKIALVDRMQSIEKALLLCLLFIFFTLLGALKPIEFFIPVLVLFLSIPVTIHDTLRKRITQGLAVVAVLLMLFWSLPWLFKLTRGTKQVVPVAKYLEAADWVKENTQEGEQVLVSWADFPVFFYRNRKNVYTNGLNPVYSFGKDYMRYRQVSEFFREAKPGIEFVPFKLGVRFAVLNKRHSPNSVFWLSNIPWVKKEFENDNFVILRFPPKPN